MRASFAAILTIGIWTMTTSAEPPTTSMTPVKDQLHGTEIVDEYRWLEGSDAPEITEADAELDARVDRWTDEQNAHTREVLDGLPGRAALEDRLEALLGAGRVARPEARGDRVFFRRRLPGQNQWTVVWREADGEPKVLLDLNNIDPEGLTALGSFEPSPDGGLATFTLFHAGDELTTLYVVNVDTGVWLADEISGRVTGVTWLPDGKGFLYHRLADLKNPYSTQVSFHQVGQHPRQDRILVTQEKEGPLSTTWGPFGALSKDGRWLILGYWTGTDSNDLWVADFKHWRSTGELQRIPIAVGESAVFRATVVGDTLIMQTELDAPKGRVVAVDLANPQREHWQELVPEHSTAVLQDISLARDHLLARYLENASSQLRLFRQDGTPLGDLDLPSIGTADVSTSEDSTEIFLSFESFDRPTTIYKMNLTDRKREVWAEPDLPMKEMSLEVQQVWYPSKDGTSVSMFLVHDKGLRRDGSNAVLLSGYGGFGISITPSFRSSLFPWLEAGGVLAFPNLRGGGEYGKEWHQAGMLERKQNVFDDFIAAGEWLIEKGYTRPQRLAIRGGSNGGLLTGAVLVQRPELIGAALVAVPLLDMLRYQSFLMARFWVPEYGTAEDPEHFPFLLKYSPYHNIRKGVEYPGVLLTAGENDRRVHPLHARKMAARLQASTASDPAKAPVLLWVDRSSGHGQGKPLEGEVESAADVLGFMMWQLGMVEADGKAGAETEAEIEMKTPAAPIAGPLAAGPLSGQ